MTDRLEDESVWAAHLYAEADPRAESKETIEVRLNSRLVKERLAAGFSWIISTSVPSIGSHLKERNIKGSFQLGTSRSGEIPLASNTKMHHRSVERHWTLVSVL